MCLLSSMQNLITLRLDHNNYIPWFFQMESLLQSLDLKGYTDGTCPYSPQFLITNDGITAEVTREFKEWNKNDKVVLCFISATTSSEALSSIVGSRNSREAWLMDGFRLPLQRLMLVSIHHHPRLVSFEESKYCWYFMHSHFILMSQIVRVLREEYESSHLPRLEAMISLHCTE
ncbi:uncharacterized protein LOC133714035 [Rosa rugosa]|uniref:uncharacterized protein LOC133714035 n=1 Tax=Rosa rugosa TaxID=74645 RepID=UPI002B40C1F7|nr:uncharacterized protein LOC133714035 [Rosa rugosa]